MQMIASQFRNLRKACKVDLLAINNPSVDKQFAIVRHVARGMAQQPCKLLSLDETALVDRPGMKIAQEGDVVRDGAVRDMGVVKFQDGLAPVDHDLVAFFDLPSLISTIFN
jgi:hypothetical protein